MNNRVLATAGYLYSANTLCLTFRVFGHMLEQSKDVGTIQIALFSIYSGLTQANIRGISQMHSLSFR